MRKLDLDDVIAGARPDEIAGVLLEHFGRAQGSARAMTYCEGDGTPRVELRMTEKRKVAGVFALQDCDPAVARAVEARFREAFQAPRAAAVVQAMLFSHYRCGGALRFGDRLQVLPPPEAAPRPSYGVDLHPLLLEVAFSDSPSPSVQRLRAETAARETGLLLAALLNSDVGLEPPPVVGWGHRPTSGVSVEIQTGYRWPGRTDGVASAFSDISAFPPLELLDLERYYGWTHGRPIGSGLVLPVSLPALVEGYFRIPAPRRTLFQRAAYWLHHARRVWPLSRSDSFLATARAIEALIPEPRPGATCDSCGRTTQKGASRLFAEFVDRFAGGDIPETQRRDYYQLRSALTHGGKLLEAEFVTPGMGPFGMDVGNVAALREVARAVLYNWLREEILAAHEEAAPS